MDTPTRYQIFLPDDDREPVDATDDYEEAVDMCRALVDEEGYARAEVRQGERLCCAADRDSAGRLRVCDAGAADDAPAAPPAAEEDVTHQLRVAGTADLVADEPLPTAFLGEGRGGSPTRWLGL